MSRGCLRRAAALGCLIVSLAAPARAQSVPAPGQTANPPSGFLTRYNFHLSTVKLSIDDQRFAYDAHVGGDIDIADYQTGRFNFLADFEPVLGSELRFFDPNQGNYTLEGSFSYRLSFAEIAAVFHHVSRHLGDRANKLTIAWNVVGVRLLKHAAIGTGTMDIAAGAGRVIKHTFADYTWTSDLAVQVRGPMAGHAQIFAGGSAELYGVDPTKAGRGLQNGGRLEAGVRINGRAGALELFGGFERRVDAYPLDRQTLKWFFAGFRLVNR